MAETALGTRPAAAHRAGEGNGARPLRRRRTLPGGRAVVGGLLVAVAAVGVFAAYTDATADTRVPYLVARHDLAIGHILTAADLSALPMDLPPALRAKAYRRASQVVGAVVIGPVAEGELVQAGSVVAGGDGGVERQISFPIEASHAVGGTLRRGEFVDVVATYGTGADAYSAVVVHGARVADRSERRGSLADRGDEVITLVVPEPADTLAVAHAVSAAAVELVRVPGPASAGLGATDTYRPGPGPAVGGTVPIG